MFIILFAADIINFKKYLNKESINKEYNIENGACKCTYTQTDTHNDQARL